MPQKAYACAAKLKMLHRYYADEPDPISITDLHGNVLYVNPSFEHTYHFSVSELRGNHISVVSKNADPKEVAILWNSVRQSGSYSTLLQNRSKSGDAFEVELTAHLSKSVLPKQSICIGRAIPMPRRRMALKQLQKEFGTFPWMECICKLSAKQKEVLHAFSEQRSIKEIAFMTCSHSLDSRI
jgi:PAS domain S-box-containing protein